MVALVAVERKGLPLAQPGLPPGLPLAQPLCDMLGTRICASWSAV